MVSTALFGAVKVWTSGGLRGRPTTKRSQSEVPDEEEDASIARSLQGTSESPFAKELRLTLMALATLRSVSVVLGLVSLKHVPASFTETVKSTAPLFTVYMQHLVLGMRTSPQVLVSLLPVMAGLVLCAKAEVSFNLIGFWAAVANNVVDCLQNVVSKKVLAKITPVRLQFYTSLLALVFQIPVLIYNDISFSSQLTSSIFITDPRSVFHAVLSQRRSIPIGLDEPVTAATTTGVVVPDVVREATVGGDVVTAAAGGTTSGGVGNGAYYLYFLANVICYHAQSISAYFVVANVTPVTMSVANTLKRTLLIVISVGYFGNQVTATSSLGVLIVIAGVIIYNRARMLYPAPSHAIVASPRPTPVRRDLVEDASLMVAPRRQASIEGLAENATVEEVPPPDQHRPSDWNSMDTDDEESGMLVLTIPTPVGGTTTTGKAVDQTTYSVTLDRPRTFFDDPYGRSNRPTAVAV